MCVCLYVHHVLSSQGQKRVLDPQELQLLMTVKYQLSAGNQTLVLCKSNKHS